MEAAGNSSYEEFVKQILRPTNFTSLKDPASSTVQILLFTNPNSSEPTETFELDSLYPFQTISDLCTSIYIKKDERDEFHPDNLCLLRPSSTPNKYVHFQYVFNNRDIELDNPFTLLQSGKPDSRFVDLTGNTKLMSTTSRSQLLLESTLFNKKSTTLYLYLYRDLYQNYTGMKPIQRKDWEGMFRPYFPERDKQYEDGSLSKDANEYKTTLAKRFKCREQMTEHLEEHLINSPLRKPGESSRGTSVTLSNIRNLRFIWEKPRHSDTYKSFDIESIFYDMLVSKEVPYIRFYPKVGEPISKVHVDGPLNIPTLEKPELLSQWSEMKSMSPEENLVMLKVFLRPGSGSVNPLFATMYIHEDGSAKFIIQPDADTKALTSQGDLYDLANILKRVTDSLPKHYPLPERSDLVAKPFYTPEKIALEDAYIVLSLWLEKEDTEVPITRKGLMSVLPFYRPFFQVSSSPLQFQHPIIFLRYKNVNNFQTPARDFQFLHRVLDLQKLEGKTSIPNLVSYYIDEFDVPSAVAETRVASFLKDLTKFSLVDPVTLDYKLEKNPGIDIAIFGKFPFYTVHIYRVNNLVNLRRIKTLLSLLISLPESEFEEVRKCYLTVAGEDDEQEEKAEEEAAEEVREVLDEEQPVEASAMATMAAAEVAANVEGISQQEFAFDDLGADFTGFGEAEAEAEAEAFPPIPLKTLAAKEHDVEGEGRGPPSDDEGAANAEEEDADADADAEEITDVSQLKKTKAKTYFLKRLNFYDQRLFQYTKSHPSLKKYSSMCAANALKQPIVLSEDEYERMKDIYKQDEADGKVIWVEYPFKKGQKKPEKPNNKTEEITVLRYGSNLMPGQANIYICSQYWCRQDDIILLPADFEGTKDRKGRNKDKDTCPFCGGGVVKNRLEVVKGETVIDRSGKEKSSSKKRHLYVRFLKKRVHPDGLYLPCCFLKDKSMFEDIEPAFKSSKAVSQLLASGEPVEVTQSAKEEGDDMVQFSVDYNKKLNSTKSWYIVGAEKLPLEVLREGPQIGILPPSADTFFAQDSRDLVINDHTVWKLITDNESPNASGFLRIAVENRKRYQPESFLAAIAPFYGVNSAADMKTRILEFIQPQVFLSLNYGNFLFDFYDPTTPAPHPLELKEFANKRFLSDTGVGVHKEAMARCWKSFKSFEAFMANPMKTKEFRHFAKFLSLPNLLYWKDKNGESLANGILFIILEVSTKHGTLEVRCPPYGISPADAKRCDVAFIIHYSSGIWEPVLYTNNNSEEQISETYMVFRRDAEAGWPSIVRKRVKEYEAMCHSSGLGIYTDSTMLNPKTLLPISVAMTIDANATAILRDSYNHVSSLLFRLDMGFVLVPVIDDGSVYPAKKIELDWRNFMRDLAPGAIAMDFYNTKVKEVLDTQPSEISASYKIQSIIRLDKSLPERADIYALHLANGLFVPMKKPEEGEEVTLESELFKEEGQEAPWFIDTKLAFGSKNPTSRMEMNFQDFEEIYQHLRFSFANWYAVQDGNFKMEINDILLKNGKMNHALPLYEKRQRLFIKLGNEILSWLDSSVSQRERSPSLKRLDCHIINTEDQCSNRCVWKKDVGACLLHVPETYDIGTKQVDAKSLMVKKLIEELIRFPLKRDELINKKVTQYIKLTQPFRSGSQYIVPESSNEWSELLRFEWTKQLTEQPKYLEEFSSIEPQTLAENIVADTDADAENLWTIEPIPELLDKYIGDKKLLEKYTFFIPVSNSVLPILEFLGVSQKDLEDEGQILDAPILINKELCAYVAKRLQMSVVQVMYEEETPMQPDLFMAIGINPVDSKIIAPFLWILQLDDGTVGILSSSPNTIEAIDIKQLPFRLQKEARKNKAVDGFQLSSPQ